MPYQKLSLVKKLSSFHGSRRFIAILTVPLAQSRGWFLVTHPPLLIKYTHSYPPFLRTVFSGRNLRTHHVVAKEFHLSQRKVSNFAQANQTLQFLSRLFISRYNQLTAEPFAMLSIYKYKLVNWTLQSLTGNLKHGSLFHITTTPQLYLWAMIHPLSCLNYSIVTWSEEGRGRPSLSHVNSIGRSPEEILQVTCARLPSWRLDGKKNGSITGGSEIDMQQITNKLLHFDISVSELT